MKRLAPLLLLAILLIPSQHPAFAQPPSLAALNVQAADLPAGFQLFADQRLNTTAAVARADNASVAAYSKEGVLRADDRLFNGSAKPTGLVTIFSLVYVLKSPGAAHQFYAQFVRKAPGAGKAISPERFGEEGRDFTGTSTNNGQTIRVNIAIFRRGVYLVWAGVQPVIKSFAAPQVIHLARLVDSRIQHAQ